LKKHFRVHDYSENVKAQIAIFNLNRNASIWWEDLRNVKGIHEKDLSWKKIEKYFKNNYMLEKYFDGNTKALYELKLGQLTIDEYINKFLELIRYVPYIKDEKVKMQQFISGLPKSFQDRIEFDEPKPLEDTMHKAMYCYEKLKNKTEPHEDGKKKSNLRFKKKGFKPSSFQNHGKSSKMSLPTKSVYPHNFPYQSGNKPFRTAPGKTNNTKREPLKCWDCGEEHLLRDWPHRQQDNRRVNNIQEATIVNDASSSMPQIYAVLDNRQFDHQASVVEMEGMISNHLVSILIDPSSNLSYVSPQTVDKCKLQQVKHVKSWLVQLSTETKIKVTDVIPACQFIMNGLHTQATLNMLHLGSYELLIFMDWLDSHKTKLDCYNKTSECEDEKGKKNHPTRNSKSCLIETNIIPSRKEVLHKTMSFVCNTGVKIC
jgi:hypothetical protein